jgi:hypothetical protein
MKTPISVTIAEETVTKIDQTRGMVPRSRIVERALDLGMKQIEQNPSLLNGSIST